MTHKPKVLVTRRWPAAVEARLADRFEVQVNKTDTPMTGAEFQEALSRFDAILPTVTDKLDAEALTVSNPQTRLLANYGVGFSHIDADAVRAHGITVSNTPDVLSDCTADLAMTLMLMVARRAGEGERELRAGNWTGWRPTHLVGSKVSGKTLGIVGFGRIGQAMAQRAHHGFGMTIVVQNRSAIAQDVLDRYGATQVASLDDLMPQCDVLSLHCPGGDSNRHLIDGRRLALMKPGAFVINTARGEVVDDHALAQALTSGHLGGAGLDVFDGEPNIGPVLLSCDKLVMLPHLGSATRETREAMGMRVFDNLVDFFEGRAPRDKVL
ncbi:D-glycerate dehydrogenase [Roseovarius gahaiensis]|uniref:D-glycerate dehydrogenase n=1 Tax=Roseovarius gahaiensis TaxID=2716691 RepID=A0A967BGS4_9RHOB|nr:D-glycerate dehydrogenase [Roseovarius gahaiensis]NHQ75911.1 D-glycerate dehydrogenase [Roseovarius gahaiensis]